MIDLFAQAAELLGVPRGCHAIEKGAETLGIFDQIEGDDKDREDPKQARCDVEEKRDSLCGKWLEEILDSAL